MIVIDSSLWLEYFVDSEHSKIIEDLLEIPEQIYVPTIILSEIYKKILNEFGKSIADDFIAQFQEYKIVDLDFQLAILSAQYSKELKLSLADSIIYTTAISTDSMLYSMDKHFKNLDNVKYFEK